MCFQFCEQVLKTSEQKSSVGGKLLTGEINQSPEFALKIAVAWGIDCFHTTQKSDSVVGTFMNKY